MSIRDYKQRIYASLIFLGAGFLLFRTISLLFQGVLHIYVYWLSILLFAEMVTDAACMFTSIPWWISNDKKKNTVPLTFTAAVILLHAMRVLVFVLGRTGPWFDFDILPEQRAMHAARWTWGGVYMAGTLSFISVILLFVVWFKRRQSKLHGHSKKTENN